MDYSKKSRKELIAKLTETKNELDSFRERAGSDMSYIRQLEFSLGERKKELK